MVDHKWWMWFVDLYHCLPLYDICELFQSSLIYVFRAFLGDKAENKTQTMSFDPGEEQGTNLI